ncbi:hypothetical protein, partial [Salmonella bongori]|uniref:hypothetical protein n=1 Tax=Salmonella bongori TaxID=54736 RepID=UPI001C4DFAEC
QAFCFHHYPDVRLTLTDIPERRSSTPIVRQTSTPFPVINARNTDVTGNSMIQGHFSSMME